VRDCPFRLFSASSTYLTPSFCIVGSHGRPLPGDRVEEPPASSLHVSRKLQAEDPSVPPPNSGALELCGQSPLPGIPKSYRKRDVKILIDLQQPAAPSDASTAASLTATTAVGNPKKRRTTMVIGSSDSGGINDDENN
jgi:hypothetical protein